MKKKNYVILNDLKATYLTRLDGKTELTTNESQRTGMKKKRSKAGGLTWKLTILKYVNCNLA